MTDNAFMYKGIIGHILASHVDTANYSTAYIRIVVNNN